MYTIIKSSNESIHLQRKCKKRLFTYRHDLLRSDIRYRTSTRPSMTEEFGCRNKKSKC